MPGNPTIPRVAVGILTFDDVEVLDSAGPFEVFSRTRTAPGAASRRTEDSAPFDVFTVGRTLAPVSATGGLVVTPNTGGRGSGPSAQGPGPKGSRAQGVKD